MSDRQAQWVDEPLFLGRQDEQERFRRALRALLRPQEDEQPFIFLLHGIGGIGKSALTRRFRHIAEREFPGRFHLLLLDWEIARDTTPALRVGPEAITAEVVFEVLHRAFLDAGWGRFLDDYQKVRKQREETEAKVARELERLTAQDSPYAALRDLGAAGLAKLVRQVLPIGESGEAFTREALSATIQAGAEEMARLRQMAEGFLKARLKPDAYALYLQPRQQLARALARGLRKVSESKPLVLLLDTYEIVFRADPWVREVIRHAGPRVVWVIAGRHNLAVSRHAERFRGYRADFTHRLEVLDVGELAIDCVLEYLRDRAPQRETSREEAAAIHRATLGVPLAVRTAGDLWAQGLPLAAITEGIPDRAPRDEIVRLMTERVLIHCPADSPDRRALYLLAMQPHPDDEVQMAALRPAEAGADFSLTKRLNELAHRYSAVRLEGGARLHEAARAFIREFLLTDARLEARALAEAALPVVRARLEALEQDYPAWGERLDSEDWQAAALDLIHWSLWADGRSAWQEVWPRFLAGLGYDRAFCEGMVELLDGFRPALSRDGRKWLKALHAGLEGRGTERERMLALLERRARPQGELAAILHLWRGRSLMEAERYTEALAALEDARRRLPAEAEDLREQIGEAFYELSGKFIWPQGARTSVRSAEGLRAAQAAADLLPEHSGAYYRLGVALKNARQYEEAIRVFRKAILLDPQGSYAYNGLGIVYSTMGRYEEAIEAYKRAIEFAPMLSRPYNNLGNAYYAQKQYAEAVNAYERAIELDRQYVSPHQGIGNVYLNLKRYDEAMVAYRRAIELAPQWSYPYNGVGNVCLALGKYREALDAYNEAIKLDPQDAAPYHGLGNVYFKLGRYDKAIVAYKRAIKLAPLWPYPYNGLGNVYLALGQYPTALKAYKRAVELDPHDATFHSAHHVCLRAIEGDKDAVSAYLARLKRHLGDASDPGLAYPRSHKQGSDVAGEDASDEPTPDDGTPPHASGGSHYK